MNDTITHRAKVFWAFDSEFLHSGRVNRSEDVTTIQFSNGVDTYVVESESDLKRFLHNHEHIKTLYAFVALPDMASIETWLGNKHVTYKKRGGQLTGEIKYRGFKAQCYDVRPMLVNFGLFRLAQCGEVVGTPKLDKPEWLGIRGWQNEDERKQFFAYAGNDAVITSLIVKWLVTKFNADPAIYASAGTLAKDAFDLPKRLERRKKTVILSPLEQAVKNACYAGRNEALYTGYVPSVFYSDAKSLYPVAAVATNALSIIGAVQCGIDEVQITSKLDTQAYGWVEGCFESTNDSWGIPLRGRNNLYVTGKVQGFFNSFDLSAAQVKIHYVTRAYKPVFSNDDKSKANMTKYSEMLLKRLENRLSEDEKTLSKAILNSLTGKLGQSKPALAVTSNFYAYSTILGFSHVILSRLFDMCKLTSPVLACDTDSVFSQSDIKGKKFELASTNGEYSLPLLLETKGVGDLVMFRAKNYILKRKDEQKPTVYGRHGWQYFVEDYLKLFDGKVTELRTRQDVKHSLLTRQIEALKLAKGRWFTKPVTLNLDKIKQLVKADTKRNRDDYDSYGLVIARKHQPSKAWHYDEIMSLKENTLGYPPVDMRHT